MKIKSLHIRNFRTLENIKVNFLGTYTVICGANDAGKTNIIRLLRSLFRVDTPTRRYFDESQDVSLSEDYPKWLKEIDPKERRIEISTSITVEENHDTGLYQSIKKQLEIEESPEQLNLEVSVQYLSRGSPNVVRVSLLDKDYTDIDAQEVLRRIQTARSVLIHNSTESDPHIPFSSASALGYIEDASQEEVDRLEKCQTNLNNALSKIARNRQGQVAELLGRLSPHYKVSVSLPKFNMKFLPYNIMLGEKKFEMPLDDWGSGTRNRALVLLLLFAARSASLAEASASKTTPVIVIEEPESFLHLSAQAEFGKILQDLSSEFNIQVIITTHNPYMLNVEEPNANILLERKKYHGKARETCCVDTSGENWSKPFAQTLGWCSEDIHSWKDLIFNNSDSLLLVEGEIDKEYLEMLRDESHDANRLIFEGEIVSYGGIGSLKNASLLNLIQSRCQTLFITYDLDSEQDVGPWLQSKGFRKNRDHLAIGKNVAGQRDIEGLLPDIVKRTVNGDHVNLVDASNSGTSEEKKNAKLELKRLYLQEFKDKSTPGQEYFENFYSLAKKLNKALGKK